MFTTLETIQLKFNLHSGQTILDILMMHDSRTDIDPRNKIKCTVLTRYKSICSKIKISELNQNNSNHKNTGKEIQSTPSNPWLYNLHYTP